MKRVLVYCEGQTEETFIGRILAPSLLPYDIYLTASCCNGVSKYSKIRKDLIKYCRSDPSRVITTMLDYYGLPSDTPGVNRNKENDIYLTITKVENAIKADIGEPNLLPYIMLHEFEALLFSQPDCFSYCGLSDQQMQKLLSIRLNATSPEHIDNGPNTAPSKRILSIYPEYNKQVDGYNIAKDIGLNKIRQECRHFNDWIEKLLAL